MTKIYLGDGVYLSEGSFRGAYVLTTENGMAVTNMITLEPEVIDALLKVLEHEKLKHHEKRGADN